MSDSPRNYDCPTCNEPAGLPCMTSARRPAHYNHEARKREVVGPERVVVNRADLAAIANEVRASAECNSNAYAAASRIFANVLRARS